MSYSRAFSVLLVFTIIFFASCQNSSMASYRKQVEGFVQNNTNYIIHPVSDSSIVREGYYGFADHAIPEEFFIKDPIISYNTVVKIPRRTIITKKEWTPEGFYFELHDGHALCFHDTTSLAYMLVEDGIVKNTIEYVIDSAITRDVFDSNIMNYNSIQAYNDYGCVHGNVRRVQERGYQIVQKFGKPVKEVLYTSDYEYDEKGRLLSYYYRIGNPNDENDVSFQTDKEYKYNSDGSFTVKTVRREKFPRGRLQVSSKNFCGFDANGRYTYEYNDNGTIKQKLEYVESIKDGGSNVDQYSNGILIRRTIKAESPDGSYSEIEYNGEGAEQCALYFGPSGVLVKKGRHPRWTSNMKLNTTNSIS